MEDGKIEEGRVSFSLCLRLQLSVKALPSFLSPFPLLVSLQVRYDESFFHPSLARPRFALPFLPQGAHSISAVLEDGEQFNRTDLSNERPVTPSSDTSTRRQSIKSVLSSLPDQKWGNMNTGEIRGMLTSAVRDECLVASSRCCGGGHICPE